MKNKVSVDGLSQTNELHPDSTSLGSAFLIGGALLLLAATFLVLVLVPIRECPFCHGDPKSVGGPAFTRDGEPSGTWLCLECSKRGRISLVTYC